MNANGPRNSTTENDVTWTEGSESALTVDELFHALTHERRRYLLYTLFDDASRPLEPVARSLAAWEQGVPEGDVGRAEVGKVLTSLTHAHVPKLVDLGIVEFDRGAEVVARGPGATQTFDVLEETVASEEAALERHARSERSCA